MALDHDRDFVGNAEKAEARQTALRAYLIGSVVTLLLGFGLVSLLIYGPILMDNGAVDLSTPPAVIVPVVPTPSPTPDAP